MTALYRQRGLAPGPSSESLQGRNPREIWQIGGAAMGISLERAAWMIWKRALRK
jgi:hypothetical protein